MKMTMSAIAMVRRLVPRVLVAEYLSARQLILHRISAGVCIYNYIQGASLASAPPSVGFARSLTWA